jgi:predicted ATPase
MLARVYRALYPEDRSRTERSLLQALAKARQAGARAIELKAGLDLARLLSSDGRPAEARELLEPIAAWFTEGADASDLVESRALLAKLGKESPPSAAERKDNGNEDTD